MKRKYKIIWVAQDTGGFNAISPVIKEIKKNKAFDITVILTNQASEFAGSQGIRHLNANEMAFTKIKKFIEDKKPDLIFTGTSDGPSIEKEVITIAKAKKIPTISIVDFWSNYKVRFSDKRTSNFKYLPDYVLAVDQIMKKEMINQGIPKEKIVITGNPFFDNLIKGNRKKEKKNLVVFFSQPFSELTEKNGKGLFRLNEIKILEDLLEALEKFNPKSRIIIKFHPMAKNLNKFNEIIKKSKLPISIERKLSAEDLIEESEIICGMNSMVLFQAALIGKKVISYQPNVNKNSDPLVSNGLGLSLAVYEKKNILPALNKLFWGKEQKVKLIEKYTKNKSTEKAINFITNLLKSKKVVCVIQARTGSTRLPRKVLLDLVGKPVLLRVVDRILECEKVDQIVVATTDKKEDEAIVRLIKGYNPKVDIFQGSENNVLDRYYKAVKKYNPDAVIRITADCPLIDPEIVDKVIKAFVDFGGDYVANVLKKRTYPRGLDTEIFSFKILEKMWKEIKGKEDREHVTLFLRKNPKLFRCKNVANAKDYSFYRWTLDEKDDYKLIKKIYQELYPKNPNFKMKEIIELFDKKPELIKINQHVEQKKPKILENEKI